MNWIQTIYCSQWYELKQKGRDPMKARLNGTLLTAVMLLLLLAVVVILGRKYIPWQLPSHTGISGKAVGQVLGLVGIAVVGGVINFTIGSEKNYIQNDSPVGAVAGRGIKSHHQKVAAVFFNCICCIFNSRVFYIINRWKTNCIKAKR
ncbi:hypothetical protein [Ferruginibacter sp.]